MNHLTLIDGRNWDAPSGIGPDTYVNDRNSTWTYDEDGRMLIGPSGYFNYDASGKIYSFSDGGDDKTDQKFDGDGRRAKAVRNVFNDQTDQWEIESTTYFVSSSVLGGQVISELNTDGAKQKTFIYAGGSVLASQTVADSTESVAWRHVDASGASVRTTDGAGQWTVGVAELDAMGADAGLAKPIVWDPPNKEGKLLPYLGFEDINSPGGGCEIDRMPIPCDRLQNMMRAGAVRAEYPGQDLEADPNTGNPNHPNKRPSLFPRTRDIRDYGLGLYGVWLPTHFRETGALSFSLVSIGPRFGFGFSGVLPQNPTAAQQPQQKKKCTQDPNGGDRPEIEEYLGRAGLLNTANPSSSLIDLSSILISREGITYAIRNVTQFNAALSGNRFRIDLDTKWRGEHDNQVGKPSVDNRFRAGTKPDKLGRKSLQVVVGPQNQRGSATGYSDLDCDNPAQSFGSGLRHIFRF